ncbi:MAG: hypothetical protein QM778_31275 [Myxococcales bacterium]
MASFVDDQLLLSEVTSKGTLGKVLKTGLSGATVGNVVGMATLGTSDVVVASKLGSQVVVRRIAFGRRTGS